MKNYLKMLLILALAVVLNPNIARAGDRPDPEFSLTPKSKEWADYDSYDLQEKLNIPKSQVKSLKTEDLLDLVLDYPFIGDIYAFNTVEDGIETIRKRFDPLDELLKREDIGEVLYKKYRGIKDSEEGKEKTEDEDFENRLKINFLELLLEKEDIFSQISKDQIKEIARKAAQMEGQSLIESEFRREGSAFKEFYDKEVQDKSSKPCRPRGTSARTIKRARALARPKKSHLKPCLEESLYITSK